MDYMTLKEASKIWGVTPRWINTTVPQDVFQVRKRWGLSGLSQECYKASRQTKKTRQ